MTLLPAIKAQSAVIITDLGMHWPSERTECMQNARWLNFWRKVHGWWKHYALRRKETLLLWKERCPNCASIHCNWYNPCISESKSINFGFLSNFVPFYDLTIHTYKHSPITSDWEMLKMQWWIPYCLIAISSVMTGYHNQILIIMDVKILPLGQYCESFIILFTDSIIFPSHLTNPYSKRITKLFHLLTWVVFFFSTLSQFEKEVA